MRARDAARGFALVEVLFVVLLLSLAGAASTVMVRTAAMRGERARLDGRQAAVAIRLLDQLDAGLVMRDSAVVKFVAGGEEFEASLTARDTNLAGAVEIRVAGQGAARDLVLDAPLVIP